MSVFRGECHQHNVKSMFLRMADATKTFLYSEKILIQKDTYTPIFTGILFTIASTWKQPKYPLTDEWIKKVSYIYTMEYYSAIKRKEIVSFAEMWMDLETVIQSDVRRNIILIHLCVSRKMNQLCIYIYPLFCGFPSHVDSYRALNKVLCVIQ